MNEDFGPHKYGVSLHINPTPINIPPGPIAVDVETDENDNFVGVGICGSMVNVYYFSQLTPEVKKLIESNDLIGHGAKFDIEMLSKWGVNISINNVQYDTKLLAYGMDSSRGVYGLKGLAEDFLGLAWPSYKEMVGKGKQKKTLDKQPIEQVARYCGMDAYATYVLWKKFSSKITPDQQTYLDRIEMPCMRVIARMENKGIMVDIPYLHKLNKKFGALETEIYDKLKAFSKDTEFNPKSPKQVLALLKDNKIKTKTTGAEELKLHREHKLVDLLLQYREVTKLRSTYVTALLQRKKLPRIRASFNQTRTITGRLSCSKPNLQNIPVRTENGALLREVFCAAPGNTFVIFDYGQVEYRLFAHHTNDEVLKKIITDGGDVHENTAMTIFNLPKKQITTELRRRAKTINFGIIYGQSVYALSKNLGISEEEGQALMNRYWGKMPRAASWIEVQKWKAHRYKTVETLCGRVIKLPFIDLTTALQEAVTNKQKYKTRYKKSLPSQTIAKLLVQGAERRATNFPFQGGSADITKLAMIECDKAGYTPILQCHDELVFEIIDTEEEIARCFAIVKPIMENVVKLEVPLVVDYGVGKTWGSAK